ncbi:unnamed protein product [Phyllotreta striolata]|uniref:PID domain-containing protein n=1 Tax=Phyllotreta striolata TaxID=444603 RepID=A0A9N9TU89_PHYSR|nr:unnamed protein product [Phyllotreta striolata]
MQTLRKKTSPMKYKNETTRFLGDGVCFKAKLIGILEVAEARGDRMCQEALSDLKMAIRAAGEHKQRITVNVAIDGLRLRDEKTGDSLYHHPVHKISFIAQDMTDSRAFGYIFGSPDTGHRFFGIKTDKAASQVVIAMRDLFQVVFALKKKEIELAKQHLEKNYYTSSPLFPDCSKLQSSASPSLPVTTVESTLSSDSKSNRGANERRANASGAAVADLVDLELELNSLQQGLNQMEKITPSSADPFGAKDDPFGDSFTVYPPVSLFLPVRPILPPPPSTGRERSSRGTSESGSVFSPKTPRTGKAPTRERKKDFSFSSDLSGSRDDEGSDWFAVASGDDGVSQELAKPSRDEKHERAKREILSQFDVFTELDPLGTGRVRPYIDRKHFFQELKNPPKKALNDLVAGATKDKPLFDTNFAAASAAPPPPGDFASDPFGEDPFVEEDPFADSDFSKQDPFETEFANFKKQNANSFHGDSSRSPDKPGYLRANSTTKIDSDKPTDIFHSRLSTDDGGEDAPEPPPRPSNQLICIKPPPLPPKKSAGESGVAANRPPPRPIRPEGGSSSPYEFLGACESAPATGDDAAGGPPLPAPYRKWKFEGSGPARPEKTADDGYLTPVEAAKSAGSAEGLSNGAGPPLSASDKVNTTTELDGLDITLSQLTLTGLSELASKLNVPAAQLSNMTLAQLTDYLSELIRSSSSAKPPPAAHSQGDPFADFADFKADFDATESRSDASYDRYAVFRELMREEIGRGRAEAAETPEAVEEKPKPAESEAKPPSERVDRYAALREIVENELKQSEEGVDEPDNKDDVVDTRDIEEKLNIINQEKQLRSVNDDEQNEKKIIEYISLGEHKMSDVGEKKPATIPVKSPVKSNIIKSPVPNVIAEMVQNNARLTSGSLSDVISGSSPEIDHTASNSEPGKKIDDVTGESWAIFDRDAVRADASKDKRPVQSEEGASPWSSDSKEFGAGSPPEWRSKDSGSGTDPLPRTRRRDRDGWWDANDAAEPDGRYCPANRRSTDSYDEEYYECYDRPRRRRMPSSWQHGGGGGGGGHSSSSRDVSPWEEEPRRRELREHGRGSAYRHAGSGRSFDRRRDRRLTDSWDEDEDYEYEDDHLSRHWSERHVPRETDRDGSRHGTGSRDRDLDRWREDRVDDRRHKRRRDGRDRRCCPDWEQTEHDKIRGYGSGRRRDREQPDERYYSKDSQESPWEDEYSNDADESPRFVSCPAAKRNWKQRPSSASEMDRKTGEIKSRHHPATGGSDGERDRHHKSTRRSRSRDSQYSEPPPSATTSSLHRRKPEAAATSPRHPHRLKVEKAPPAAASASIRKQPEATSTFPRRATAAASRARSAFENDFVAPREVERAEGAAVKVNFESDSDKSSPMERPRPVVVSKAAASPRYHQKAKSHRFEDDFSPGDKAPPHEDGISSIKEEEADREEDLEEEDNDEFAVDRFERVANGTRRPSTRRRRFSSNLRPSGGDAGVRKSESVDIFAREDDPFDDDFFCGGGGGAAGVASAVRCTELRWTDDYSND